MKPETGSSIVTYAAVAVQAEKIDELGSTRGLAGARKLPPVDNNVDGAGFSCIRATRKRDFNALVRGKLAQVMGADEVAADSVGVAFWLGRRHLNGQICWNARVETAIISGHSSLIPVNRRFKEIAT